MSWKCYWFGCKPVKIKEFDNKGLYYMDMCHRCGTSKVHFVREGITRFNHKTTLKTVKKCMDDPKFVAHCVKYRKYAAALKINDAHLRKLEMIRFLDEYGLKEGDYVPDPILLFEIGRWFEDSRGHDKPNRKRKKENAENSAAAPVKPTPLKVEYHFKSDETSVPPNAKAIHEKRIRRKPIMKRLNELSLTELEALLEKCLNIEAYEKAAVIKKEIDKRMENLK